MGAPMGYTLSETTSMDYRDYVFGLHDVILYCIDCYRSLITKLPSRYVCIGTQKQSSRSPRSRGAAVAPPKGDGNSNYRPRSTMKDPLSLDVKTRCDSWKEKVQGYTVAIYSSLEA